MKLLSFIGRRQKSNAYLENLPPDIEEQETARENADEIMDIIYHPMTTMWKNKIID